ncbi:MAG: hypothetical protein KAT04_02195 [Methylococcales bacterium]|nr:hypothetical protein [Methylococcales bacterium]
MLQSISKIALTIPLLLSIALSQNAFAEDAKREGISQLVRLLGYGGAIHNFKNYVLRGDDKYRKKSDQFFTEAKVMSNKIREQGLDNNELVALKSIEDMIASYQKGLAFVKTQHETQKSLAAVIIETDAQVKVDDTAAIEGINVLRKNYTWNELESLEYNMGYGGAIHNFKNYLLRGKVKYKEKATKDFNTSVTLSSTMEKAISDAGLQTAATDIKTTSTKYLQSIPRIQKTAEFILKSTNSRIISSMVSSSDKMVRVDDSPAINGISTLGRKYHGNKTIN